jgi:hypothetical protein
MADLLKWVLIGGVVLIALPVLLSPVGWPIALGLIVLWVVVVYGVDYLLDLEKSRRMGERAQSFDIRHGREDQ